MKYFTLTLLSFALFFCAAPTDPVQEIFTAYIKGELNDPESFEFVSMDSVHQHRISWAGYLEARGEGVSKAEGMALDKGADGFISAWATYRAKNKFGGVVTQQVYVLIEDGKVFEAKNWNEALPHLRK